MDFGPQRLLPVLYGLEFFIALIAVYTLWGELGGAHLDYMPWYWKGAIGLGIASAAVKLTEAMASDAVSARKRAMVWAMLLGGLVVGAGLVTFYYHLNEPQDENEDAPAVTPTDLSRGMPVTGSFGG